MTTAPILRSAALQRALAAVPARRSPAAGSFASSLASAQSRTTSASAVSGTPRQRIATNTRATTQVSSGLEGGASVPFQREIGAAAAKYGLDPALLAAVVKQESNFNPSARSGVGAKGLTQLMDSTARGLGVTDSFDPAQSLDGGAKFLSGLLKQFHGDESLALAAYNAGPGAVQKYGGIPPYQETQKYVPQVLRYATQYRRIWADSVQTN